MTLKSASSLSKSSSSSSRCLAFSALYILLFAMSSSITSFFVFLLSAPFSSSSSSSSSSLPPPPPSAVLFLSFRRNPPVSSSTSSKSPPPKCILRVISSFINRLVPSSSSESESNFAFAILLSSKGLPRCVNDIKLFLLLLPPPSSSSSPSFSFPSSEYVFFRFFLSCPNRARAKRPIDFSSCVKLSSNSPNRKSTNAFAFPLNLCSTNNVLSRRSKPSLLAFNTFPLLPLIFRPKISNFCFELFLSKTEALSSAFLLFSQSLAPAPPPAFSKCLYFFTRGLDGFDGFFFFFAIVFR